MKAVVTHVHNHPNLVEVHLSSELPLFPPPFRPRFASPGQPRVLSRATHLESMTEHLCRINRGNFSLELPQPRETFRAFLEELAVVKGLVRVVDVARYSLTIEVGRCFPVLPVCQAIADCIVCHFYSSETVVVESWMTPDRLQSHTKHKATLAGQG